MKLIKLFVLVDSQESREFERLNPDDICPRGMLIKKPMIFKAENMEALYPDSDKRCTVMYGKAGQYILASPFDDVVSLFDEYLESTVNRKNNPAI